MVWGSLRLISIHSLTTEPIWVEDTLSQYKAKEAVNLPQVLMATIFQERAKWKSRFNRPSEV